MATVPARSIPPTIARARTVLPRFLLLSTVGVALSVAGELATPWDLTNAISVAQYGLVFTAVATLVVLAALRWPAAMRFTLLALAALTALTVIAYFLALAWVLGCAGVTLSWAIGALPRRDRAAGLRLERACGLVCGFVAIGWFVAYLSSLITDLL